MEAAYVSDPPAPVQATLPIMQRMMMPVSTTTTGGERPKPGSVPGWENAYPEIYGQIETAEWDPSRDERKRLGAENLYWKSKSMGAAPTEEDFKDAQYGLTRDPNTGAWIKRTKEDMDKELANIDQEWKKRQQDRVDPYVREGGGFGWGRYAAPPPLATPVGGGSGLAMFFRRKGVSKKKNKKKKGHVRMIEDGPARFWAGGSPNFDESTGQYRSSSKGRVRLFGGLPWSGGDSRIDPATGHYRV